MAVFKVEGGHRLHGTITPQGAKNEALQILCAVLLTSERVVVNNVPAILDVLQLIELLRRMGVEVEQLSEESYAFTAREINFDYLQSEDYRKRAMKLRGSVMLIGPLLARYGVGYIPKPGGDKIGRRRLDTHFIGFQKLGAKLNFELGDDFFAVEAKELKGCYMLLDEASVTGTANIVMAAVMAKGTTTIYNAACEPYLQQLCKMLVRMGAKIAGIGSNLLTIHGVEQLEYSGAKILGFVLNGVENSASRYGYGKYRYRGYRKYSYYGHGSYGYGYGYTMKPYEYAKRENEESK